MLLRKITLEEFGAYRGKQSLDLTVKKNKPIILIGDLQRLRQDDPARRYPAGPVRPPRQMQRSR